MTDTMHGTALVRRRPSRRDVLQAAASAAVAAALPGGSARAQASPFVLKVGTVDVTVLSDGVMSLPLSFMLPTTDTKAVGDLLAGHGGPADALVAQVNVAVLKTSDRLVLVDAGGSKDFMSGIGGFAARFEAAGFKPDAVTDIVLTHAHPDHLWGAIDELDEPRFPNARIHMSVAERDYWIKSGLPEILPDALKGMAAGTQRRLKILASQIHVVRPGTELLPGMSLVDTAGHTPGHASVLVASGTQSLLFGGDALSNAIVSFQKPEWVWGADMDAGRAIATRRTLLDRLAVDRTLLLGYHLPWPGLGRVERKDGAYRFVSA